MKFIDWMDKELKEGTFKQKHYYLKGCICGPNAMEMHPRDLGYDTERLNNDLLAMRQRYESIYGKEYWDPEYVSHEECLGMKK